MTIATGDTLPSVAIVRVTADGPEKIESSDFFKGRRVALFCVPGAFTPVCSARHLPGFVEQAEAIKAKGIDEIAALAVNDPFVMAAWGKQGEADGKVALLSDGNAAFVTALGLDADLSAFGMGTRAQRFSMVVDDGRVEQLNVEEGGSFGVSSAEHLLQQL